MDPATETTPRFALHLIVDDVDRSTPWYEQALAAGATPSSEVQDAFWGVRTGEILDPSGHRWAFDQPLRDVSVEEIENRLAEFQPHSAPTGELS
jgi:PhnB protein